MAVGRRSDIYRNGCGDAADSGIPDIFGRLLLFFKRAAEDAINRSLCVGGCMNDKAVVLFQLGNPVLNVSGRVAVGVFVGNSRDSTEEGSAHLCD